jgi:hypothetical protein
MTFKKRMDEDLCKTEAAHTYEFRREIPKIVEELVRSCNREECFDHIAPEPLPSRDLIIDILARLNYYVIKTDMTSKLSINPFIQNNRFTFLVGVRFHYN